MIVPLWGGYVKNYHLACLTRTVPSFGDIYVVYYLKTHDTWQMVIYEILKKMIRC